jgi:phenylacetaldehyde dehydrogenase
VTATPLELLDLVDGSWVPPANQLPTQLHNQLTREPVQQQAESSPEQVDAAIAAAWRTHLGDPGGADPATRTAALTRCAEIVETHAADIAEQDSRDSGVPISITRLFAGALADTFRAAAGHVPDLAETVLDPDSRRVRLHRLPLGPAAVLAPWNAPTAVAAKKAAYAWAAGAPVIVKPSPWAPHGTRIVVEVMAAAAAETGLPTAAIQLVHGGAAVGQQLAADARVRAMSVTGGRAGGRAVAAAAASNLKSLQLELGSNNPALVLPDADLPVTIRRLSGASTFLNGAWCESPGNVYAPADLVDDLVDGLLATVGRLAAGDPLDDATTFGPQAHVQQHAELLGRLQTLRAAGASIAATTVPDGGYWFAPTVVRHAPQELTQDEIFGPVLVVHSYRDLDDAVARLPGLATGLAAYLFTQDIEAGMALGRLLPAGEVKLNGGSVLDLSPHSEQEFWYGSGVGGHGDRRLAEFFTGARIVGQDVDSPI